MTNNYMIDELSLIFGSHLRGIFDNWYGIDSKKKINIDKIESELKNPEKRRDIVRFYIKEKDNYMRNNLISKAYIEVGKKPGQEARELFLFSKTPYFLSEWEGVGKAHFI